MNFLSLTWWRKVFTKGGRVFAIGCAFAFIAPIAITAGFQFSQRRSNQPEALSGTIATVNGDPITDRDWASIPTESLGGAPGSAHASAVGYAIYSLVQRKVLEQMAKKQNVHASDADIDRAVAKFRKSKLGATATDAEWESYVTDRLHMATSDFRDAMVGQAGIQALVDHYKNAEKVTLDDARNQNSEVKLATVFIAAKSATSQFPGAPKSLPDAEALKKATELHASVVAGKDITPLVKANPDPFQGNAKKSGVGDWQKENMVNQFGSALMFGKDVDEAVQKTPVGKITDVVKASGFQTGYFFAKVVDRRINTPKDYDAVKVVASLKEQRAGKKLSADVKAAMKVAKVEFPKDQSDKKAYYDYAKVEMMQQEMQGSMMGSPEPGTPTQADVDAQKALYQADFEAALKAHPDDTSIDLLVAEDLQSKMFTAPQSEQSKIRDRLIGLYETAFKSTEDITTRFTLAGLYKDKHDYKSAFNQYSKVNKLLADDPPYDLKTRQSQLANRDKLVSGLMGLPAADVPEAPAAIGEQNTKIVDLKAKIAVDQKKEEEQKRQADAQRKLEEQAKKAADDLKAKELLKSKPAPSSAGVGTKPPVPGAPATAGGAPAPGAANSLTRPKPNNAAPAPATKP